MKNNIFEIIVITILVIMLSEYISGCVSGKSDINNSTPVPNSSAPVPTQSSDTVLVYGHVYLNGTAISDVHVDAISVNGTYRESTLTDDHGAYKVDIMPDISYNITATYRGLQHTIWPVYLPGETNTFDINLTTVSKSFIEGSGYTMGGPTTINYSYKRMSGFVIGVRSTKDNSTISTTTDGNGDYSLEVKPDILYSMTGTASAQNKYPVPIFHYRNYAGGASDENPQIMAGLNETVLVDYIVVVP